MNTDTSTPTRPTADAPKPRAALHKPKPEDMNELPVNIINDRLGQAHATLDLIYTMTANYDCSEEHIETLCKNTLSEAIHSAMLRIEEALEAAKGVHS